MERKQRLIDKRFVHKKNEENVLIYNMRRVLPVKIDIQIMEEIIFPNLDDKQKGIILEYYIKHIPRNKNENGYYIMYNIPHIIGVDYIEEFINSGQFSQDEIDKILKHYHLDELNENYLLNSDINELQEIEIANAMSSKDLQLIDCDHRDDISELFENINGLVKEDLFYCNMFVNLEHPFFFEHTNEHVPAMMLNEASRQFLIAISHVFGKIPLDGTVSFILTHSETEYKNYLELNYPIKMIAKANNIKKRKGLWNEIDVTIFIYQRNIECSSTRYVGRSISKSSFKLLRKDKVKYDSIPRFQPLNMFQKNISIRDFEMNKYIGNIIDLSEKGFQISIESDLTNIANNKFEFFIFFHDIGFIHGNCELKWMKYTDLNSNKKKYPNYDYQAGFEIVEISQADLENLKEVLKRFCYVIEKREIL